MTLLRKLLRVEVRDAKLRVSHDAHSRAPLPVINGHEYSFARYMADRKYAVLAIDQLGAGESTKPADGDAVTLDQTASGIHQVIARLRSGENAVGYAFEKVVTVGPRSAPSTPPTRRALTTTPTRSSGRAWGTSRTSWPVPAELIRELLQYEYFKLPDALRPLMFYYAPGADPDAIQYDAGNLADFLARGQLTTGILPAFSFDQAAMRVGQVTGPVLVQLGEFDGLSPASLAGGEAAYFTSASSVTVQPLAGVGHDFNTHFRNHEGWKLMNEWLRSKGF